MDTYEAPQRVFGSSPPMPSLDPKAHRDRLLQQLDDIVQQVGARAMAARDELATREIIAVRPGVDMKLSPAQLDDSRADARFVGIMPETGTVVLDVANADLGYLRRKIDAFADDANVTIKNRNDGTTTVHRDAERAIAPVGSIGLAALEDIGSAQFRAEELPPDRAFWFEIGCRGGYRNPPDNTKVSRAQIARQLHRLGSGQRLDEFMGPEQVYFFVRLTREQLGALREATDCIYEVELAPQPLRDLKLLDDLSAKDVAGFALTPPHDDAPSVVVLDTGIATGHPLLKAASNSSAPERVVLTSLGERSISSVWSRTPSH